VGWVHGAAVLTAAILAIYTYAFLAEIVPRELRFRRVSSVLVACLF
jgi:hypothetical protein